MWDRRAVSAFMCLTVLLLGSAIDAADVPTPPSLNYVRFYTGNEYYAWPAYAKQAYIAGVFDALEIVNLQVFDETVACFIAHPEPLINKQTAYVASDEKTAAKACEASGVRSQVYQLFSTIPGGIDTSQLQQIVDTYVKDHPAERQNSASLLVWRALATADWN